MLGINAKLYWRSGGTYEAPTWSELSAVSDLAVNPTWDEGDASTRESRVKQSAKTMMGLEITGKIKKKINNAGYEAIMGALVTDQVLDVLVLDASKETVGARGWRLDAQVFNANEDQGLGTVQFEEISIKPCLDTNPVKAVKVGPGPALTYATPGGDGTFA